jgi:hypothetical protein
MGMEIVGTISEILGLLDEARSGERHVIVYPDLVGFRKIYGQYTKKHLEQDNELVILLPHYETVDSVIAVLQKAGVDVATYGRQGFLLIMDAYRTYSGFQEDRDLLFKRILTHAAFSGRTGISIILDMGVFSFIEDVHRLAAGRRNIVPAQESFKIKGFLSYHMKDYSKLSKEQKAIRFSENYKTLLVTE